jgi:hypothetical protein
MATIIEMLTTRGEHLFDRFNGPLNFRLIVMPLVVTVFAIRGHFRDAREGKPLFRWPFRKTRAESIYVLKSGFKDFGKVFIMACLLDTIYQIMVLKAFFPGELIVVAMVSAVVPYFLVRGPLLRVACWLNPKWAGNDKQSMSR